MLKAAAAAGADAVYLGLDRFNARSKAENFNDDFFRTALSYCHLRDIKVYVTFNTLIKESEFDEATRSVDFVVESGADGIIVQDFGIMRYVATTYPDFPLHVSTQAGVCTKETAEMMRDFGAKRVVLSRETSLDEVERIANECDVELEYFVQGALCVCFSGNCYMSSIIDGNSGNRGRCAQVCRKKATLCIDGRRIKGYNLSTKDTMLLCEVERLVKAGVKSFKIEGRMRSPEYVYYAVRAYKLAVSGESVPEEILQGLRTSFNRGDYSTAYISGRRSKVIYNEINSNIGIKIGEIAKICGRKAIVRSDHEPTVGDGFKVLRNGEEVGGGRYLKSDGRTKEGFTLSIDGLKVGDEVRLNYSESASEFVKTLDKKVPVAMEYKVTKDIVEIKASCNGIEFSYQSEMLPEYARSRPLEREELEKQLKKCGETDFIVENIDGALDDGLFLIKSDLNEIRRRFFDELKERVLKKATPKYARMPFSGVKTREYAVHSCVIVNEKVKYDFDADAIVFHPEDYSKACEINCEGMYLYVPCYLDKSDEKMLDEVLSTHRFKGCYADGTAAVAYARSRKTPYILGVCCNLTNYAALELFPDAEGFVSSKELNKSELLHGGMTLSKGDFVNMTFVHCPIINSNAGNCSKCPFKNGRVSYEDEAGRVFLLYKSKLAGCLFYLMNNKKIKVDGVSEYLYDYSFIYGDVEKELRDSSSNKGHYNKGIT